MNGPAYSIREILVPTDLSAEAAPSIEHARQLAARFDAGLTLYHAVEVPDPRFAHWAFAEGSELWARAESEALAALRRRSSEFGPRVRVLAERTSSAHRAIVSLVKREQPDLIVMATHGRTGLAHLLLGSVTEKVIQQVYRPLLCLREPAQGGRFPYRRIVVPTDLSLASRLAFPIAAFLAGALGAEIVGIHVLPPPSAASLAGIPEPRPVVVPSEAALWKFLQADFAGLELTAQVHTGTTWERIVHAAGVEQADLIVMSTRGHDSLADHILGSNTERVVRHAPCPVLVT